MNRATVSFGLEASEEETKFSNAIQTFLQWRAANEDRPEDTDTPGLIIKTCHNEKGGLRKTLIFDEARWAEAFLTIWQKERRT